MTHFITSYLDTTGAGNMPPFPFDAMVRGISICLEESVAGARARGGLSRLSTPDAVPEVLWLAGLHVCGDGQASVFISDLSIEAGRGATWNMTIASGTAPSMICTIYFETLENG